MTVIFRGDDTSAFNNNFITINLENPQELIISKAIFVCGCVQKTFERPVFPLVINFSSDETIKFKPSNVCHLVVFDNEGKQKTCTGTLTFSTQSGVI